MFTRVLCPIDFSECSAAALRYAVAIAQRTAGRVLVLYVNDPLLVASAAIALGDRALAETSRNELRKFVAATLSPATDGNVTCHVAKGKPHQVITAAVSSLRCDLIVMGTHGLGGFDKMLVGSTTERLLGRAPAPILVIPPALEAIGLQVPDRQWPGPAILTPIDLGPHSADDLGVAAKVADAFDASLLVLHVVPELATPRWYRADTSTEARLGIEKARRQLEALTRSAGKKLNVEVRVRSGAVPGQIAVAAAAERVSLVVMRLRKGPGLFGSRTGSIAYHVLRNAITPVLALPAGR